MFHHCPLDIHFVTASHGIEPALYLFVRYLRLCLASASVAINLSTVAQYIYIGIPFHGTGSLFLWWLAQYDSVSLATTATVTPLPCWQPLSGGTVFLWILQFSFISEILLHYSEFADYTAYAFICIT